VGAWRSGCWAFRAGSTCCDASHADAEKLPRSLAGSHGPGSSRAGAALSAHSFLYVAARPGPSAMRLSLRRSQKGPFPQCRNAETGTGQGHTGDAEHMQAQGVAQLYRGAKPDLIRSTAAWPPPFPAAMHRHCAPNQAFGLRRCLNRGAQPSPWKQRQSPRTRCPGAATAGRAAAAVRARNLSRSGGRGGTLAAVVSQTAGSRAPGRPAVYGALIWQTLHGCLQLRSPRPYSRGRCLSPGQLLERLGTGRHGGIEGGFNRPRAA